MNPQEFVYEKYLSDGFTIKFLQQQKNYVTVKEMSQTCEICEKDILVLM
jgi:hypothetical protein